MHPIVEERGVAIRGLAVKWKVRSLAVFGSAVTGDFDPSRSDLDFLVEFQPVGIREYADHYFGLLEDLERLFGCRVDLVEAKPIRNPYFLEEVSRTKRVLYEAA
jgi:predicted nucleotidyltransferase